MDEDELFAASTGSLAEIKALADAGADLNHTGDGWLGPPIVLAANDGNEEVVRFLLDAGVEIPPELLATVVYAQFLYRRKAVVLRRLVEHLLVERKVDPNQFGDHAPALHLTSDPEVVALLIDHGADVNLAADDGETSLHAAARRGADGVLELLLDRGADANVLDKADFSPLDRARETGGACAQILEKHLGVESWTAETILRDFDFAGLENGLVNAVRRAVDAIAEHLEDEVFAAFCFDCNIGSGEVRMCLGTASELDNSNADAAWDCSQWDYQEFEELEHPLLSALQFALRDCNEPELSSVACTRALESCSRAATRLVQDGVFTKLGTTEGFEALARNDGENYDAARARIA